MHCYEEIVGLPGGFGPATICEDVPLDKYFPKNTHVDCVAIPSKKEVYINEKTMYPKPYVKIHEKLHLKYPGWNEYKIRVKADDIYNKRYGVKTGKFVDSAGDFIRQSILSLFGDIHMSFEREMRKREMKKPIKIPGLV